MVAPISTCCFRNPEALWSIHPLYTLTNILDMENQLLKYRNYQIRDDIRTAEFIYHYNALRKDIQDKQIDPYPYKVMLHPQTKK